MDFFRVSVAKKIEIQSKSSPSYKTLRNSVSWFVFLPGYATGMMRDKG